jgi:nuclease-like protein
MKARVAIRTFSHPRRQQIRRLRHAARAGAAGTAAFMLATAAALAGEARLAAVLGLVALGFGSSARSWLRLAARSAVGARSEAHVRRALRDLERDGWSIRHGLGWAGTGDIDDVAVSPTGVAFAIETKTSTFDTRHLAIVRDQAAWLRRRRPRWCRGGAVAVLCVTRGRTQRVEHGVHVVSVRQLTSTLRRIAGTAGRPDPSFSVSRPPPPAAHRAP